MNSLQGIDAGEMMYGFTAHAQDASIQATKIASGFGYPGLALALTAPPDDPDHLFVAQRTGVVKVVDVTTGQTLAAPFLDVSSEVPTTGEQGMLGFAFDPDYATNGHGAGTTVVGGYVYRGQEDAFHGRYFFGDMNKHKVWTIGSEGERRLATDVTPDIADDYGRLRNPIAFGEDALGNLYLVTAGGDIIRLAPQSTSLDQADTLDGGGGDDAIYAGAGDDKVFGGTGDDMLNGMAGDDSLDGGAGQDRMSGGRGDDIYVVDHARDVVLERSGEGRDIIRSKISYTLRDSMSVEVLWTTNTAGTASLDLTGNKLDNRISGNAGSNALSGLGGDDMIRGLSGDDAIKGGFGRDDLHGGAGRDRLMGEAGADKLEGGTGLDTLAGGSGADTFVWLSTGDTDPLTHAADLVVDFDAAEGDRLSLLNIDAKEDRDGPQAFTFIGTAGFTRSGQVGYAVEGEQTVIYLNTDADHEAEGAIRLAGIHAPRAEWFVL